jgi:hypothetical protein
MIAWRFELEVAPTLTEAIDEPARFHRTLRRRGCCVAARGARAASGNCSATWPIHSFCAGLSRAKQTLGSMTT